MASITITIKDEKAQEVKNAFLALYPKPSDFTGTDLEWLKEVIKRILKSKYVRGKKYLKELDLDIFE